MNSSKKKIDIIQVSTKRKTANAHVVLKSQGSGLITINDVRIEAWQPMFSRQKIFSALSYLDPKVLQTLDIEVHTTGGGFSSITDASIISILRSVTKYLNDLKLIEDIKEYDRSVLVPDTRRGMSKTPLGKGARAREQKSYR